VAVRMSMAAEDSQGGSRLAAELNVAPKSPACIRSRSNIPTYSQLAQRASVPIPKFAQLCGDL
jgi:hypothetical protein